MVYSIVLLVNRYQIHYLDKLTTCKQALHKVFSLIIIAIITYLALNQINFQMIIILLNWIVTISEEKIKKIKSELMIIIEQL